MSSLENEVMTALITMLTDEPAEALDITSLPDDLQAQVTQGELTLAEAVLLMKSRAQHAIAAFEREQVRLYLSSREAYASTAGEDFLAGFRRGWSSSAALATATIEHLTRALIEARGADGKAGDDGRPR